MKTTLNITNGDSTVSIMQQAKITGDFLPWRDVLHDGPVPKDLNLEALSQVRAKFISDHGWGDFETLNQHFIERDNVLKSFQKYRQIILWFEHDLYDQLQIIQILDWLNQQHSSIPISIVCTDNYLGLLTPDRLKELIQYEQVISQKHLVLAQKAWQALRADTPEKWHALLKSDLSVLPFLEGAIIRLLEEYPSNINGLSRTALQALSIIADGETNPLKVFGLNQKKEERIYLGDSSFWHIINELLQAKPALLTLNSGTALKLPVSKDQKLSITEFGKEVLTGNSHYLTAAKINRWIGGTHLQPNNIWLWNSNLKTVIKSLEY